MSTGGPEELLRLPAPCLVVLAGPGAAGKSTWAATHFPPDQIVSADRLRAVVGGGEDDLAASADAFALLEEIVTRRTARRLTTVVDTLGTDPARRARWRDLAAAAGMACVAVAFDVTAAEARARNRARPRPLPADVLTAQLRGWPAARAALDAEGFAAVLAPAPVRVVPPVFAGAAAAGRRQADEPLGMRFALHVGAFPGPAATLGPRLREIAVAAEDAGFHALYVMDHLRQIPQVGRAWDDLPEAFTTLAHLAAATTRIRLGTLVSPVTFRNVGLLAKAVATLDVLSGGRAVCGLGLGWFAAEHRAYGLAFPPPRERYALLEDTLRALPALWGPGGKPFRGAVLDLPDTSGYPRPLQARIPIVVGGGGRRTLGLAARHADAANVLGDLAAVAARAAVLREACATTGRDPAEVTLSHLSTVLVGADGRAVDALVERLRPRGADPARFAAAVHAGTVADHVGRVRELAETGVGEVAVRLLDLDDPAPLTRVAPVIAAFRP